MNETELKVFIADMAIKISTLEKQVEVAEKASTYWYEEWHKLTNKRTEGAENATI